ncbi:MAG: hypothetical protein WAQ98_11165 [Blastocatellia bacterium]|jgi:hypothetical protein
MKKYIFALFLVLVFNAQVSAQEQKQPETEQPKEEKKTYELQHVPAKAVHISILTINKSGQSVGSIKLTYEDLPEAITITNPNDKAGAKEVRFTRQQIWRFLQYFNALTEHIERAWAEDK